MEERSVTIYKLFIDANNKFDQFILAMLVTLWVLPRFYGHIHKEA